MAASFFSEFGLMWYLGELSKNEFRKFKELLKHAPPQVGLRQLPWNDVKKATREDLANLLVKHYREEQAWDITLLVFRKIDRGDLCEKAKKEITGHTKKYRAHVKEKFSKMWFGDSATRIHDNFQQELTQEERKYLEGFFAPTETKRQTMLLRGVQGVGKTTLLVKLMLAWTEGSLYRQRFSYVFYFCCRQVTRAPETSLAELICAGWSDSLSPVAEITSEPGRLLFILDGFEELKHDLDGPDSDLCSDWTARRPGRLILSSLLRKKMLPEASLLVVAAPVYPRRLERRLENPEVRLLEGFRESERKLYFCCLFQDRSRAIEAFGFVRDNEQLLSMCKIPVLCWLACTCLKQEMDRGHDLAPTCRRTTSLYASFVLNLFAPKGAGAPAPRTRGRLTGLCSLAAEGMWTDTFVFSRGDLRRNGLAASDLPALLDAQALRRCPGGCQDAYSFIHVCVQEFCAALFYFVRSHTDHPHPAVGSPKTLVWLYLKKVKVHWIYLGCFVCGLLHPAEQQKLEAFFGRPLRRLEVQREFQAYLGSLGRSARLQGQVDFLSFCYCLYEMEDEDVAERAVNLMRDARFSIRDTSHLVAVAYCLQRCSSLRTLCVSTRDVFAERAEDAFTSGYHLACWYHICSVLTANENLTELTVTDSKLRNSEFLILSSQLKHPWCRLQKLQMHDVSFPGDASFFFEVLIRSPHLVHLDLSGTKLSRDEVSLLCDALNSSVCNVEKLLLSNCGLSHDDCERLRGVLQESTKLKFLNLSCNHLGTGPSRLCEALRLPTCILEILVLDNCYFSEDFWEILPEVLLCNQTLIHLDLSSNILKQEHLNLLCEALAQPNCRLMSLCLTKCFITADGCRDLALVFTRSRSLTNLELHHNNIGDQGMRLLCEALIHPSCHLQSLGLEGCRLTGACCETLASVLLVGCRNLRRLVLSGNALGHDGVLELCQALGHPECRLRVLGLKKAEFDEETQKLLTAVQEKNPSLVIVDE